MSVGIPRADLDRFTAREAGGMQAAPDLLPGLVAEGLAEGEPDAIDEPLLGAVPGGLEPVSGILLLEQQHAPGRQPLAHGTKEGIPSRPRQPVEHVENRHRVEGAAGSVGGAGHGPHPGTSKGEEDLSQVRFQGERTEGSPRKGKM